MWYQPIDRHMRCNDHWIWQYQLLHLPKYWKPKKARQSHFWLISKCWPSSDQITFFRPFSLENGSNNHKHLVQKTTWKQYRNKPYGYANQNTQYQLYKVTHCLGGMYFLIFSSTSPLTSSFWSLRMSTIQIFPYLVSVCIQSHLVMKHIPSMSNIDCLDRRVWFIISFWNVLLSQLPLKRLDSNKKGGNIN